MQLLRDTREIMLYKYCDRVIRFLWYILARIIRLFCNVNSHKIICIANDFNRYDCHPKFITEYIIKNHPNDFEITWVFRNPDEHKLPQGIKSVKYPSFLYLLELYSSKYVIYNKRMFKYDGYFIAKHTQKYIMTWHDSGFALKKIEKDAKDVLSRSYIKNAKLDSSMCSLMLSSSRFQSELIRRAFWYDGEILEKGLPRIDIFAQPDKNIILETRNKFVSEEDDMIVLYAPTFRNNIEDAKKAYIKDWNQIICAFKERYQKNVKLLFRFHPNLIGKIDFEIKNNEIEDVTLYDNMQELLLACDILITDYSSCMFDAALMNKPCFLYASDYASYDRGFYFDLKNLPFSFAESENALTHSITTFNEGEYKRSLKEFMDDTLGMFPIGNACEAVYEWMIKH